jgi:hypothetical protein
MNMDMKTTITVLACVVLAGSAGADDKATKQTFTFDKDKADAAPAGFSFGRTGEGREGAWVVKAMKDSPSAGNVLAQTDADTTDFRFPVAVADAVSLADVAVAVKCKPVSGKVDEACGLVARYQDPNNYYVTRANALEGNVRFYYVKDGKRQQVASWSGRVAKNKWHSYKLEAKGDHFVVTFDGKKVLDLKDKTFAQAGKVGLWTKADSVTYFDNFTVEPR